MDFIKVKDNMAVLPFDYKLGLYRRNNFGQPCVWYSNAIGKHSIEIYHGIVGKTITHEIINTDRNPIDETKSRMLAKRKTGYKKLSELRDSVSLPVEGELYNYLCTYLDIYRTAVDGSMLPMLAKVYDNTNNKVFKKVDCYIGQWKINGLRCFISAKTNNEDMFKPIKLLFQSREGTYWNSLYYLEDYLLSTLDNKLIEKMIDEHYILDGEVYLPGHSVNEINHFVKDDSCPENKLLQYWCYDIAIEDTIQSKRAEVLYNYCHANIINCGNVDSHLNNREQFVVLPPYEISNDTRAVTCRNKFIDLGFEGLILRNPTAEYQYGKRNMSMIKYKDTTDGIFEIIDIKPEGIARQHIPLFVLHNDINDACFEVHINGSQDYQSSFLKDDVKSKTIGKKMYVSFGERSGINKVPFHVKVVKLVE